MNGLSGSEVFWVPGKGLARVKLASNSNDNIAVERKIDIAAVVILGSGVVESILFLDQPAGLRNDGRRRFSARCASSTDCMRLRVSVSSSTRLRRSRLARA